MWANPMAEPLVKRTDGRVVIELDEATLDAYVRAGIDRRLDALFEEYTRQYVSRRSDLRGLPALVEADAGEADDEAG